MVLDDLSLNLSNAIILTDNKPVLEWLNISVTGSWGHDYNSTYTRLMVSKGIPLFK